MTPDATPVEMTRDVVEDLRARRAAGEQPAAYVLRHGAATWVTVSVEDVIANIPAEIVEAAPGGGFRVAYL